MNKKLSIQKAISDAIMSRHVITVSEISVHDVEASRVHKQMRKNSSFEEHMAFQTYFEFVKW